MKRYNFVLLLISVFVICCSAVYAANVNDTLGVVRCFGETNSWMSSCAVIGDGSWVVTTADSITEKINVKTTRLIKYPIFISPYTGEAYECEVKAVIPQLDVALLKLPVSGLPAFGLAGGKDFSKVAYGTTGDLMQGVPIGSKWDSSIYAIMREETKNAKNLIVSEWSAEKAIIIDMDKYKVAFISDITPEISVPNGALVVRNNTIVGLYTRRLVFIDDKDKRVPFGQVALSTEINKLAQKNGVSASVLESPPDPKIKQDKSAKEAFQLYARLYSLIAVSAYDDAVKDAEELVKLRPQSAQAWMLQGVVLNGADKTDEAIVSFETALKLDPKLPNLRTSYALAKGDKKPQDGETELLKSIEEFPDDIRPVSLLASYYFDNKQMDNALKYAKKAASMDPNSPSSLMFLAKIYKIRKEYVDAIKSLQSALKLAPEWPDAWFAIGATYEEAGDKVNALASYKRLANVDPKNPIAIYTYASFLADEGKNAEATEQIDIMKKLDLDDDMKEAVKSLEDKISKNSEQTK